MSSEGTIGLIKPRKAHLLLLPQELRDNIFHQLFDIASTIVVERVKVNEGSTVRFKLLQPLPVNILRTSKKIHADAKLELQKYIGTARLIFNCSFSVFQDFIDSLPDYVKESIKQIYLTPKLLFTYNEYTRFAWKKTSKEEWSPICQKLVANFTNLQNLAIYVPLQAVSFYCQETPMEICHLLEMEMVQKVQFVYRKTVENHGEECENLMHVQEVLRGAYKYPDSRQKRERPEEFAHELSEWQKLPKKFNLRREEENYCQDELWWASPEVLVENYSAHLLRGNGPRTVITLTRRN
ncbi:hypothetical protein EG328_011912 [Venturia inaequalis]|uniref:Uncharacterized protein n=1 Tax=Venturia inaequalis TaxID=5025 RepID=A0A8H3Z635_VENIN|nr:hypothetical protein EG328_011912 [Venturia inaequalis]